ncbi:MAG: hypothetical protein K5866_10975 [Treponema sp.]|nr:hypothetical protein [Treponema sp.]
MSKDKIIEKINPLFLNGICHRGYHNQEFSENGLKAFQNAIDHNMALEFDVHLTKDGKLVVFHDSDTKRMTGKEGIIEDLTFDQIRENYRLLDGEIIPSLKEVLDFVNERVPMVVELKVYRRNWTPLAKKVLEELECIKDKKNVILISFDPRALFKCKNKGYVRQLLVAKSDDYTYPFRHFFEGLDIEYVMLKEKRVQRYIKKHFSNTWTIEGQPLLDQIKPYLKDLDTITFQFIESQKVKDSLRK